MKVLKVLTLTQPWATLVMLGEKNIETRSWSTAHRGLLGIHAAKGFPLWARDVCNLPTFARALFRHGVRFADLPRGQFLGARRLREVTDMAAVRDGLSAIERAFGDYNDGRYAWHLDPAVTRAPKPIECRGALGLWNLPPQVMEQLTLQGFFT